MKKFFTIVFFILIFLTLNSQEFEYIKTRKYEACIFSKNHFTFLSVENQKERYTPTLADIKIAEKILYENIDIEMEKYSPYPNKPNGQPRITKKTISKYKRQYLGFLTTDGDTIIYINLLKDKELSKKELNSDIIWVLDGGSDYWQIFVNISKSKLFGLSINGIA